MCSSASAVSSSSRARRGAELHRMTRRSRRTEPAPPHARATGLHARASRARSSRVRTEPHRTRVGPPPASSTAGLIAFARRPYCMRRATAYVTLRRSFSAIASAAMVIALSSGAHAAEPSSARGEEARLKKGDQPAGERRRQHADRSLSYRSARRCRISAAVRGRGPREDSSGWSASASNTASCLG